MTTHHGQGFAVPIGQTVSVPDRQDLARKAAQRLTEQKEVRRAAREANEERDRRTLAVAMAVGAAMKSYHESGGVAKIQWVVTAVPISDDEPDPFLNRWGTDLSVGMKNTGKH